MYWTYHQAKRVTLSAVGGDVLTIPDINTLGYKTIGPQAMLHRVIPLSMLTDSLSLFDDLSTAAVTTKKPQMIDPQPA